MLADKFLIQLKIQGIIHAGEVSSHDDVEINQKTITPDQVPPNRKNNISKWECQLQQINDSIAMKLRFDVFQM